MADVFISYERDNAPYAEKMAIGLEQARFSVFFDKAIFAGERWNNRIEQELDQANAVVVLWSKRAAKSHWVFHEAMVGLHNNRLCPAVTQKTSVPTEFRTVQSADLRKWRGEADHGGWRRLLSSVDNCIKFARPKPTGNTELNSKFVPASDKQDFQKLIASARADRKPEEAYVHVLMSALFADGETGSEELDCLKVIQQRSRPHIQLHFDEYVESGKTAFARDFDSALFAACKSLPRDMAESAFANAAVLVYSDQVVMSRELKYLDTVKQLLGISEERAKHILEVIRIIHAH